MNGMTGDALTSLHDRVIMVTGATGGIGREVVAMLHRSGARLSLCDLDRGDLDALVAGLPRTGGLSPPSVVSVDLSEAAPAAGWAQETARRFGRIDGLVNVAGYWRST